MTFSIVHATARFDKWQESAKEWLTKCKNPHQVEYILGVDDPLFRLKPGDPEVIVNHTNLDGLPGCVRAYNSAAKRAIGKVILLNSDDMFPSESWDNNLLNVIGDNLDRDFVVRLFAGHPTLITFQILSRVRYEKLGYVLNPEYHSLFADNEFTEHAELDGVVIEAPHIKVEHRHPIFGFPWDEVYERENNRAWSEHGYNVFNRRKSNNFK